MPRANLSKSEAWLEAAVESLDACRWDVAAGSAVTAGISACDAITGALIGQTMYASSIAADQSWIDSVTGPVPDDTPATTVPEPTTLAACGIALLPLLRRRQT